MINYNFKRDYELAKQLISDIIASQPTFYDINPNCGSYVTNGKTNIYSIDMEMNPGSHIQIVSILDYEPIERENEPVLRINFAVKNNDVSGYCRNE